MAKQITVTFLFLLVGLLAPFATSAIGVSATPATLSVKTSVGKEVVARFTVRNPSKEVGLFEAYPEEFEEILTLIPSRFVLEAGEKREVLVRVMRREAGALRTAIAVEAHPLGEPAFGVGGGVRLPFSLEVRGGATLLAGVFASTAGRFGAWFLVGLLTAFVLLRVVSLCTLKRLLRSGTLTK